MIKKILKILYFQNQNYYSIWTYLYVHSENNQITTTLTELSAKLKTSRSTTYRALKSDAWNQSKVYAEVDFEDKIQITFYPSGKKEAIYDTPELRVYTWLKEEFYPSFGYMYPNIHNHQNKVSPIMKKVRKIIGSTDDDQLITATKVFFENIPEWWKKNQAELPAVNKHFTKIFNQINQNGTDKYTSALREAEHVNY